MIAVTAEKRLATQLPVEFIDPLFRDGVESVGSITARMSHQDWEMPACGQWSGTLTARHLLAVARWYHAWLDRAIDGDASPPFDPSGMDHRNDDALTAIGEISGGDAIAQFAETAMAYLGRAVDNWDLAYGYPYGTVTVGLHCGVAAAEWHLHAWDLSHGSDGRHHPQNARALFTAAGLCVAAATGGLKGHVLRSLVPLGSRLDPWSTMLRRSGRSV